MNYILYDDPQQRKKLDIIVCNKPISSLQIGLLTIKEKWEQALQTKANLMLPAFLNIKYPTTQPTKNESCTFVNSSFLPNEEVVIAIKNLKENEMLVHNDTCIASKNNPLLNDGNENDVVKKHTIQIDFIQHYWSIMQFQKKYFEKEFAYYTSSLPLLPSPKQLEKITVLGDIENIKIGKNVIAQGSILDARNGKIIIEDNVLLMPNSVLSGNVLIKKNSVAKIGAQVYGTCIIGEHCVIGGEIKNVFIGDFSNKGHYGYLGDAYIGRACNLGAGTTASNIKNTASEILITSGNENIYNIGIKGACIMGDYSRCAINTIFNTACLIGVSCNIFNHDFYTDFYLHFSWSKNERYKFEKAIKHIQNWLALKQSSLQEEDIIILKHLYKLHEHD